MEMETGTLARWNEEKGFGFIKPHTENSQDVFIHISALKQMARKPIVGDEIKFCRERHTNGKVRAIKASIEGVAIVANSAYPPVKNPGSQKHHSQTQSKHHDKARSSSSTIIRFTSAIIIVSICSFGFIQYQKMNAAPAGLDKQMTNPMALLGESTQVFHCETGKVHCRQMRSCEEAMFYIQNCPGTKMDGDGDGIPCERQHCR